MSWLLGIVAALFLLWLLLWLVGGISSFAVHVIIIAAVVVAVIWLLGLLRGSSRGGPV